MGEDRAKHFNSKHDDAVWRGFFARWHAGERADRLRVEAGVSPDTWSANAKRLGMRRKDLPPGHPGRRAAPAFADRADDWRHPNSRLTEGQWRDLFRQRLEGVPDTVLAVRFGVAAATICSAAEARGVRRADVRAVLELPDELSVRSPPPPLRGPPPPLHGGGSDGGDPLGGVVIDPRDAEGTRAAFDAAIVEAGARGDFVAVALRCRAKAQVERAIFAGAYRPSGYLRPQTPDADEAADLEDGIDSDAPPPVVLRPAQIAPSGDWRTWLFLGGRGAGKTLAGASWLAEMAERCGRLALVGPTLHDVREVMIGGPSGVMALDRWRGGARPAYAPSRRRLVFPNGAEAHVFSAEDPDSLRGPQFAAAWADEYAAWGVHAEETLAMLRLGLRLPLRETGVEGAQAARLREPSVSPPRLCVTTTPRPTAAMRRLRAEAGLVETRAATAENAEFLAPGFLEGLNALYGGTRRAAQELEGKVVEAEGSLFTAEMMEGAQADGVSPADMERVVVAVDPTATSGGCACGIVVVGRSRLRGNDDVSIAVVLDDRSAAGLSPQGWAARAVRAADDWGAQAIVAETNQGGDMVEAVLRAAGAGARYRPVRAQVGKRARAEPVAALYEQGRVRHARRFAALEEELMALGEDGGANDRADALVWAVTELMLGRRGAGPRLRTVGEAPPLRGCLHDSLWSSPWRPGV